MFYFASVLPLVTLGIGAPQSEYLEQFEKISVAASSFQTCEQLGFSVDRQGIVEWSRTAKQQAVAAGMSEHDADVKLKAVAQSEWQRVLDRHAEASLMQHSQEHVARNNRLWLSRCEKLAMEPSSARYFSNVQR